MVDLFPEQSFADIWYSASGEGDWTAPRGGGPANFDVDVITASELLSELEALRA